MKRKFCAGLAEAAALQNEERSTAISFDGWMAEQGSGALHSTPPSMGSKDLNADLPEVRTCCVNAILQSTEQVSGALSMALPSMAFMDMGKDLPEVRLNCRCGYVCMLDWGDA